MGNKLGQNIDRVVLTSICARFKVKELSLFGSSARGDFRPDSDVDILVDFLPDETPSLFDMVELREELKALFGREVDLVSKDALLKHHNTIRKKSILEKTEMLYAA
jgi:predicted nucleotidyltransferase